MCLQTVKKMILLIAKDDNNLVAEKRNVSSKVFIL